MEAQNTNNPSKMGPWDTRDVESRAGIPTFEFGLHFFGFHRKNSHSYDDFERKKLDLGGFWEPIGPSRGSQILIFHKNPKPTAYLGNQEYKSM